MLRSRESAGFAESIVRRIFVSYRREDSRDVAGRIYDRLVGQFGAENVFKDVDSIPFGADFRRHIRSAVERCDLFLAVIGPRWSTAASPRGARRLDDASDFVRLEIAAALERGIPVIPLLVGGATMPPDDDLPPEIRELAFRNAAPVRADPDFHRDMDRLIAALAESAEVAPASTASTASPPSEAEGAALPTTADAELPYRYDLFLSFAPGDREWTLAQVYEPLSSCRSVAGRPLRICLDWKDAEIERGLKTMRGLAETIRSSRSSIVVVSNEYLERSMGRWRISVMAELEEAAERVVPVFRDPAPGGDLPMSPLWLQIRGMETWSARSVDARAEGFFTALVIVLGLRRA